MRCSTEFDAHRKSTCSGRARQPRMRRDIHVAAAGVSYRASRLASSPGVDVSGIDDAFYFDVSHDQRSRSYELVNAQRSVTRRTAGPSSSCGAGTCSIKDYAVRGFYFGNEPPDFPDTLYTRARRPDGSSVSPSICISREVPGHGRLLSTSVSIRSTRTFIPPIKDVIARLTGSQRTCSVTTNPDEHADSW